MSFNPSGGALSSASDVALSNPADSEVLTYDTGTAKWKNKSPARAQAADYVVWKNGTNFEAVSTKTAVTAYSGTDAGAALSAAITALGTGGGTICFRAGSYTWNSIPQLPKGLTNWLRIVAEPGTTIALTTPATGGNRFLDFASAASAGDTFQYIWIEGFTVDAAALSGTGGTQHIIVGNYGMNSGLRCNYQYITLKHLRSLNVRVAPSATAHHLNVFIQVVQDGASQAQNKIEHIYIEDINMQGGNHGVTVYASKSGSWTGDPNVYLNDIVVRQIRHDMLSAPTAFDATSHVHVGARGYGDNVLIDDVWGYGTRDVGVEVDGMMNARISNVYAQNFHGFAIALTNYNTPANYKAQIVQVANIYGMRDGGSVDSQASSLIGIRTTSPYSFGMLYARNCEFYRTATAPSLTQEIDGELLSVKGDVMGVSLTDAFYHAEGQVHDGSTLLTPSVVYADQLTIAQTKITLRNVAIRMAGSSTSTGTISLTGFLINGDVDLDMQGCSVDWNWTGGQETYGLDIAGASNSTIRGRVQGFKVTGSNLTSSPKGIRVSVSTRLTIPSNGSLQLIGNDLTAVGATNGIKYDDVTNRAKIIARDNLPYSGTTGTATIVSPNSQTLGSYTLALTDAGGSVDNTGSSAVTVTVPPNSTTPYVTGTVIQISQQGTGQVTIAAGAGVTLRSASSLTTRAQYSVVNIRKTATDTWLVWGDLT